MLSDNLIVGAGPRKVRPEPGDAMVSIGSRHHEALRLLRLALNGGLGVTFSPVAPVLSEPLLDTHPEWTALIM